MKKIPYLFVMFAFLMAFSSCASVKNYSLIQGADTVQYAKLLYDAKIMPKDLLTISVNTVSPEAGRPFNLVPTTGQAQDLGYLVDNDGNINFPVIGKIHVVGLTKNQCQDLIEDKIRPYLAETERPVVTVRMSSYSVTVMGEVGAPRVVPITTEKMNVLQALASVGGFTIYGKRTNVKLIREDAEGGITVHTIDLHDPHIINSPYYYVQQNDIIYVEAMKVKAVNAYAGVWLTSLGIVTSLAALLISILK